MVHAILNDYLTHIIPQQKKPKFIIPSHSMIQKFN